MAQHRHYWSCSKFAAWIRGTKKLDAGTSKEWREWNHTAKTKHPFRFWLSETVLDNIQDFVTWPTRKLYDIKYYINNRWVTKSHACTANKKDIKPGDWHDVGYRFLPCLFNELVDFVEIELAWSHIAWSDKETAKKYKAPFWSKGWFRWRTWRCPEAGVDNLAWQAALKDDDGKPTPQALDAKEIAALYTWWTFDYPARPDAFDASGWTAYCDNRRGDGESLFDHEDETEAQRDETRKALNDLQNLEEKYDQEDEDMLIRLIKIRRSLWT